MQRSLAHALASILVLAVAPGAAGAGVPPPPLPAVEFHAEVIGMDCHISVIAATTAKLGRAVEWTNDDSVDAHNIHEMAGLWSKNLGVGVTRKGAATAAGTFSQQCDAGPTYAWKVKIKSKAHPKNPNFKVTWAIAGAKAFWRYNVQYSVGGGGWRTWKAKTSAKSAKFHGHKKRTYRFRARVINANTDDRTGWSPTFKVVT